MAQVILNSSLFNKEIFLGRWEQSAEMEQIKCLRWNKPHHKLQFDSARNLGKVRVVSLKYLQIQLNSLAAKTGR